MLTIPALTPNVRTLGCALALLSACGQPDIRTDVASSPPETRLLYPDGTGTAYSSSDFMPLYSKQGLKISAGWGELAFGSEAVVVLQHNVFQSDGTWQAEQFPYSTSFRVNSIGGNAPNVFYVAGTARNDDVVIEKWDSIYPTPPGGGAPDYLTPPGIQRTEIYRGADLGQVIELGPDPEDRFVLVLHTVADPTSGPVPLPCLSRVDGPTGDVQNLLYSADSPALDEESGLFVRQHTSEGRIWFVEHERAYPLTAFYDYDNDGAFDNTADIPTEADWNGLGYDGSVWLNDFTLGWYWD